MANLGGRGIYELGADDLYIWDKSLDYQVDSVGNILKCGSFFTSFYIRDPSQESGFAFDFNIDPPWQLSFHHATQTDQVVVGGFGSAKTVGAAVSALTWTTLIPWAKFLNTAPLAWQSRQMYDAINERVRGTLYQERFLPFKGSVLQSPYPKIIATYKYPKRSLISPNDFTNDFIAWMDRYALWGSAQSNTLEFMSVDKNANKILTWEGDWVHIDQGEAVENLQEAIVNLGTRVRGAIRGRTRLGKLTITANAGDSTELWDVVDMCAQYPEDMRFWELTTKGNKNLTDKQLNDIKRRIKDPAKFAQYLEGKRPEGEGLEFTDAILRPCLSKDDNQFLTEDVPSIEFERDGRMVTRWSMPADRGRSYVVFGDPGQGKAPYRNAPVVMVWDFTDYPKPAKLVALWWGNGGGSYQPWMDTMTGWREKYRAVTLAYDATGGQKAFAETAFKDIAETMMIDLGGAKKKMYLTALKLIMQKGRLSWPEGLTDLRWQLKKYKLPDEKLSQDLVATLLLVAAYISQVLGYDDEIEKEPSDVGKQAIVDRYARAAIDRNARVGR